MSLFVIALFLLLSHVTCQCLFSCIYNMQMYVFTCCDWVRGRGRTPLCWLDNYLSRSSLSFRWCPQPGKTFGSGLVEKYHPAPITNVGGGTSASQEIVIVYQWSHILGKVSGIPNLALKNSSLGDFFHHAVGWIRSWILTFKSLTWTPLVVTSQTLMMSSGVSLGGLAIDGRRGR